MRNATLRQLKVFETVARHLSFSRAAEELHLTQPAVSTQVRQLEEHAGLPLFEQLEAEHPGQADPLRDVGKCHRDIAIVLDHLRQPAECEAAYGRAADYLTRLVALTDAADDRALLAGVFENDGFVKRGRGAWDRAEERFTQWLSS